MAAAIIRLTSAETASASPVAYGFSRRYSAAAVWLPVPAMFLAGYW